jgi:hypothetical protein
MAEFDPELRVTGIEKEAAILVQKNPGDDESQPDILLLKSILHAGRPKYLRSVQSMYSNGSRQYVDAGPYYEYCTPEDLTLAGTVANEKAGDEVIADTMDNAVAQGLIHDYIFNNRVMDETGHTLGYHNSFEMDPDVEISEKSLAVIGMHLATANILVGAGGIRIDPKTHRGRFVIAQKASTLNKNADISSSSDHAPLISLRNESLGSEELQNRLHVTSIDSNPSPWATWMRLGMISLVLRLREQGYMGEDLMPVMEPFEVARQVAEDLTLRRKVLLQSGRELTPLEIQWEYLARVESYAEKHGVTKPEKKIIPEWERTLSTLEQDPERMRDRADWPLKKAIIDEYLDRHDLSLRSEEGAKIAARKDRQYDNQGPKGFCKRFEQGLWRRWMSDPKLIERRKELPPATTRALPRSRFVWAFDYAVNPRKGVKAAYWPFVQYGPRSISLGDVRQTKNEEIDRLIDSAHRYTRSTTFHT